MAVQKNYIREGHIRKRNKGELPIYMVAGMFEPLVSKTDFDKVQEIRKMRAAQSANWNPVLPAAASVSVILGRGELRYGLAVSRAQNAD